MRFYVIIALISYSSCLKGLAQQVKDSAVDSLAMSLPEISIGENNDIDWIGFPAYSDDRKTILLIHQNYSCCFSYATELIELKLSSLTKEQTIVLFPDEGVPTFSFDRKERIIDSVSNILKKKSYHSLIVIDLFETKNNSLTSKHHIDFKLNEASLETLEFQLPKMLLKKYCCNDILTNRGEFCEVTPDINKIWIEPKMNFVLIEYGFLHQGNGCDKGPEYMVVKITR